MAVGDAIELKVTESSTRRDVYLVEYLSGQSQEGEGAVVRYVRILGNGAAYLVLGGNRLPISHVDARIEIVANLRNKTTFHQSMHQGGCGVPVAGKGGCIIDGECTQCG